MATTSFPKMKCEIVPENSYRIIHSYFLLSVIEKAIYSLPKNCWERKVWKPHTWRRGDENKTHFLAHDGRVLKKYNGTIQSLFKKNLFMSFLPCCMLTANYSLGTKQIPKCIQTYAGTQFTSWRLKIGMLICLNASLQIILS